MNILVANDDGIQARGIAELAKALSKAGNVYVAAPNSQRSASSHALSVNDEITMKKIDFEGATMAFEVGGTPADCVKLALYVLRDKGIDIDVVYAGINHGGNLGTDTMYSGTVSAAAEGLFNGINTPDIPADEIKGVKTATLGKIKYHEWFNVVEENGDKVTYSYSGTPKNMDCWSDDTDAKLVRDGYATISSVKYDQNDVEGNAIIEKWNLKI